MSVRYFLGLDNGGTKTKAAVFDRTGKEIACCSVSSDAIMNRPDFVERNMEEMWQTNCTVIRMVLIKSKISARDIGGVGICGHGKGLYLWGKDGKPDGLGILSADNRAVSYLEKWRADGTEQNAFQLSCQHVMACQPVALLAWIRDNEPERYQNIRWIFECKDYVRFRLTGEARAEITDYSGTNLMELHTGQFSYRLLKLFGITEVEEALPPLCQAGEMVGRVTREAAGQCGLEAGTPVIGGMFDINACAMAAGILDSSRVCMIAGTWSINEYIRRKPVLDGSVLMNSLYCLPGYYLVEESSATSAGNNEWFVRELLPEAAKEAKRAGRDIYEVVDSWVEEISPEDYVPVFLPFLMASNVNPRAQSCFIGLKASHTRKHLARSIFEGITFGHRYHLERLLATRTQRPEAIRLVGGASRARVWAQMFADVTQLPVEVIPAREAGALGCAILAACAVGEYPFPESAVANMTRVSERFLPYMGRKAIYDAKYRIYLDAVAALDGLWERMRFSGSPGESEAGN